MLHEPGPYWTGTDDGGKTYYVRCDEHGVLHQGSKESALGRCFEHNLAHRNRSGDAK